MNIDGEENLITHWASPGSVIMKSCHGDDQGPVLNSRWCSKEAAFVNRKAPERPIVRVATRVADGFVALERIAYA